MAESKTLGAYYTPPGLARHLCAWAIRSPRDRVLDPSCGEGVFLESSARVLLDRQAPAWRLAHQIHGTDVDARACAVARDRLSPYGVCVTRRDFFEQSADAMNGETAGNAYDCVVGNPPFIRYQRFSPEQKELALQLCRRVGVPLNQECSAWAPFVVLSMARLKPDGRLAMIIPREALFVNYAHALFTYLKQRFTSVDVVAIHDNVFPAALVKVAVLLCDGSSEGVPGFRVREIPAVSDLPSAMKKAGEERAPHTPLFSWTWSRLPVRCVSAVERALASPAFCALSDVAAVRLGVVTGDRDFFVLSDDGVRRWNLSREVLTPVVSSPSAITGTELSATDPGEWLLTLDGKRLRKNGASVRRYLRYGEKIGVSERFKCRIRNPWYRIDPGSPPQGFLGYLCSGRPRFALNPSGRVSTNNVHRVVFHRLPRRTQALFAAGFNNPLTLLTVELIGRSYGGGVLKIEPGDAARIRVPVPSRLEIAQDTVKTGRDVDRFLRRGDEERAIQSALRLVQPGCNLTAEEWKRIEEAYWTLRRCRLDGRRASMA